MSLKTEEIEIKVKIEFSQVKKIRKRLSDLGAVFKDKKKEEDIYFTSPGHDFIKTKECLRIRKADGKLELTYKGPTTKTMERRKQFWKQEINIPLDCSKKDAGLLLEALCFKKIVEVIKERETFILGNQTITIDQIEEVGWFLEIERIAKNKKERKNALEENIILLEKMGLNKKNIMNLPYRDIVLKNKQK